MKKEMLLMLIVLLAALPAQALAVGISPGVKYIEKDFGTTFEHRGLIVNNEHKVMTVTLEVEGPLKGFINVEPKILKFTENDKKKEYIVQVMVPFSINEDETEAFITASEQISSNDGSSISAVLSVKSRIIFGDNPANKIDDVIEKLDRQQKQLEQEAASKTTGLVVGKGSKAGLFQNKLVGIILLTAGLLIMSGLLLLGVSYKKQSTKEAKKQKIKKKKEKLLNTQKTLLELEAYVLQSRKKGVSKDKIQKTLEKKGWDKEIVKEILSRENN
jgi:hypothetical protein